ncbi:MAG: SUMF1/EgtB/PvdO family nonheme iron enzyme [Bacteroidota bacterium]
MKIKIKLINLIFILHLLIPLAVQAQIIIPENKPKQNNKPTNSQPENLNKLTLKILANKNCIITIDTEDKGLAQANVIKKIYLPKGEFLLEAKSTEDSRDIFYMKYTVVQEDINSEKLLGIDIAKVTEARLEKEKADIEAKKDAEYLAQQQKYSQLDAEEEQRKANEELEKDKARLNVMLKELSDNMVVVEGGTYTMGCTSDQWPNCYGSEKPAHEVSVGSFYISKYEVTRTQWKAVMGVDVDNNSACDNCPVENVSWDDAQEFIAKLNALTGQTYRLPTEAEWEFAARGGNLSKKYKYPGSNKLNDVAWLAENSNYIIHPVGMKKPNELGLYDMGGNVWEWCSDWFGDFTTDKQADPPGADIGSGRVVKGGSYLIGALRGRCASRGTSDQTTAEAGTGFRLAKGK